MKAETEAAARFIDRELPNLEKLARAFLADARRLHEVDVRVPGSRAKPWPMVRMRRRRPYKNVNVWRHRAKAA